jgi:hypothetical protein
VRQLQLCAGAKTDHAEKVIVSALDMCQDGAMNDQLRRVARINKRHLSALPADWTQAERGRYLRLLFRVKGIDPDRLFHIEYFPQRRCWLLLQPAAGLPDPAPVDVAAPASRTDEAFYLQTAGALRRAAIAAFAAFAAHSSHFARAGAAYQLPAQPQELTSAHLKDLCGHSTPDSMPIRFTAEGGWLSGPSEN